jgi:serine/threonine protein phosphatase PrpC
MQGWRKNMEDAHLCQEKFGDDLSLFGVFDGHGGKITKV